MNKKQTGLLNRVISGFIAFTFLSSITLPPGVSYAQLVTPVTFQGLNLPAPGAMVAVTPAYMPPLMEGLTVHPQNPLEFDFIVSPGDEELAGEAFNKESEKMIKYFLAALTVPENELWVNLSPYEKDKIIPESFGQTEMGRDLLAQDYLLKQLSASLMYPEEKLGQEFWQRVYKKAYEKYGTTEIPLNTFNKIWVMPEKAVVYQTGASAFVVESKLKVMLEEDYLALEKYKEGVGYGVQGLGNDVTNPSVVSGVTSDVVREVLIPEIEKEVNQGKTFANLRQVFNSLILATWYKRNLKESLLGQIYVDQNKIKGIDLEDKTAKEKIYNQYLEALQKGVFNYIKEDYDPATQRQIPRKYFSGGVVGRFSLADAFETIKGNLEELTPQQLNDFLEKTGMKNFRVSLVEISPTAKDTILAQQQKIIDDLTEIQQSGTPLVRELAGNFLESFQAKIALVPFYSAISNVSEDEIRKEILEDTYAEYANQLRILNDLIAQEKIFPAHKIRTSENEPAINPVGLLNGRRLKTLQWPMKGDPWQSGHLWMILEGLSKFGIDSAIPTIDDTEPRKPDLSSLAAREALTSVVYDKFFGDLVKTTPLMRENHALATATGERVVFSILALNPDQEMDYYYGAGSDHANLFALQKFPVSQKSVTNVLNQYAVIKGQDAFDSVVSKLQAAGLIDAQGNVDAQKLTELLDALREKEYVDKGNNPKKDKFQIYHLGENSSDLKLNDLPAAYQDKEVRDFIYQSFFDLDVVTKLMFYMMNDTEGYRSKRTAPAPINVIFSQRKGEEVSEELLQEYEDWVNEHLARASLPVMKVHTITQPLDSSSTQMRAGQGDWKMPSVVTQIAQAFGMWSFETEADTEQQKSLAQDLFQNTIQPFLGEAARTEVQQAAARATVIEAVKKFNGQGINAFDTMVVKRMFALRDGTAVGNLNEQGVKAELTFLDSIRNIVFAQAKELARKAVEANATPVRAQHQDAYNQFISIRTEVLPKLTKTIKFGTSGNRRPITDNFHEENVPRDAYAAAMYTKKTEPGKSILTSFDPRKGNAESAKRVAAINAAQGVKTIIINEPTPTPVLALLAQISEEIGAVINLTASHNPKEDDGFKYSPSHGGASDETITDELEKYANSPAANEIKVMDYEYAKGLGLIVEMSADEAIKKYVHNYLIPGLKDLGTWNDIVNYFQKNGQKHLIEDPMQGTAVKYVQALFAAMAKDVGRDFYTILHINNNDANFSEVDGQPRPEAPGSHQEAQNEVRKYSGDAMAILQDGDDDRFGNIDPDGTFVGANDMIGLIAFFLAEEIGLKGAIGKTVATSNMVNAIAEYLKAEAVDEEAVGFKNFVSKIINEGRDYLVAGEESAHVAVGPFMKSWDDGLVVGLMGLWIIARTGMTLQEYKKYVLEKLDMRFQIETLTLRGNDDSIKEATNAKIAVTKEEIASGVRTNDLTIVKEMNKRLKDDNSDDRVIDVITKDGVKLVLNNGWILLRPSGTEPAVKAYAEAFGKFADSSEVMMAKFNKLKKIVLMMTGVMKE